MPADQLRRRIRRSGRIRNRFRRALIDRARIDSEQVADAFDEYLLLHPYTDDLDASVYTDRACKGIADALGIDLNIDLDLNELLADVIKGLLTDLLTNLL